MLSVFCPIFYAKIAFFLFLFYGRSKTAKFIIIFLSIGGLPYNSFLFPAPFCIKETGDRGSDQPEKQQGDINALLKPCTTHTDS